MNIHVRTEGEGRVMVNGGANAGHVQNFTADNGDAIGFLSGRLIIGMNVSAEAADFYEKVAAYAGATGNMEIAVNADLTLPIPVTVPANANYTLTIKSGSAGTRTITRGISDTGAGSGLFIVSGGAKLLFESIVIDGNHRNAAGAVNANFANNAASLVRVNSRGEFTMNAGAALKNNRAANGGGVYVYDYSGTFTMNGGVISDNTAAGGGSGSYGGGVYVSGGMFNMHGGEISGNTATGSSGDSIYGGGVYVSGGTFNMHGGVISANTASSAYEYGGGGGVYVNGAFNMSGNALISENTASNGGGVHVSGGAFNMIGSAVISDNTASTTHTSTIASGGNGGGVYVGYGTFNMSGNALISGNTASSTYTSYGNGGGVYVSSSSIFNMSGGKIIENRISAASASSGNGGGVFNAGTLRVGGASEIHGNTKTNDGSGNNAYLAGGNYIVLGDAASTTENVPVPATGMNIHVRTAREDGVLVNSGANAGHVRYFTADNGDTIGYLGGRLIIGMNVSAEAADFYEKVAAYAGATGNMEIAVNADLTLPIPVTIPANADYTLTIKSGSAGTRTITRGTSDTGAGSGLFIVSGGVKLLFEDIIINGNNFSNNAAPLVRVNSRGELTLNAGAALRNNRAADGGAVYLNGAYGTGNTAALTMNAGSEISGNMATSDGGGVYAYYGTFTMNGGVISGNTASGTSIYGRGAGVYVGSNSTFNMGGNAVISGNTASSTSTNYGNGGGVYIYMDATFNMSGNAVISGNTASSTSASAAASGGNGGGVYVSDGTFNMSGGKIIENKVSSASTSANSGNGGGVYNNGTFRLGGASEIHGNTKTDDGSNNNAYLTGTTHIVLGNGTSTTGNVPAPAAGMNIHVRTAREDGVMVTSGADAGHVPYFTADEAGKQVTLFGVDTLRIQ
jgi:LysM repeat protein